MKSHYSIQELIIIQNNMQNSAYPKTRQAFEYRAKSENWPFTEEKSAGRNGLRRTYQIPADLALAIHNHNIQQAIVAVPALPSLEKTDLVISTHSPAELATWQRDCATARLLIVREIQARVRTGVKKTKVIEDFIFQAANSELPEHIQSVLSQANARAGSERTVSRRSVFEWIGQVEDAEKYNHSVIAVLAPKPRMVKLPDWAGALLKLWGQPQKPNLTTVLDILPTHLPENVPCPSYSQAYRFITEKMGNVEAQKGRMGSRELKNIQPFKRRDTSMLMPSDVYTADGHCFDAEVAHPLHGRPFRPEITSIIDIATRLIVGYSIDLAESGFAVLDAIRKSACEYGVPALFYVDNGSGYVNELMKAEGRGLMAQLGTEMTHALPYNSQAKGIIERSHKTLWVKAAKTLPTYIGKDMDDQARQKVFKVTRKDIKEFGVSKALIGWPEFLQFAADVVQQYNAKPHSALPKFSDPSTLTRRHYSPFESWNLGVNHPDSEIIKIGEKEAEDLFRPSALRQVRRGEIDLFGNKYFSRDLEQYHSDMVTVAYDIHDPSQIWVRDEQGRLICKAVWNGNKSAYFAKSVIEQAKEKRAQGRLRRLAVKQAEALEELSPRQVIEHQQAQTIPIFGQKNHAESLAELNSLEPQAEIVHFPMRKALAIEEAEVVPLNDDQAAIARWSKLDDEFINFGEIKNKEDFNFWRLFQLSKRFGTLKESSEELRSRLEMTASIKRV